MAIYPAYRIRKPPYFRIAPYRVGVGKRVPYVIGFDSEAERGKPFLFQFAHPAQRRMGQAECDLIEVGTGKHAGLGEFIGYLIDHCVDKTLEYIVVGFNLQYEWTQLYHDVNYDVKIADEFVLTVTHVRPSGEKVPVRIVATNNKRFYATFEIGATKRRVKLMDAMSGWAGAGTVSLDTASKIIGTGAKLPKPKEFSRKAARTPEFLAYAKQDAILTQKLGEYILGLHRRFDVPLCISAPHFAARVFRRKFLSTEIPLPTEALEQFGLDSYHGGKNGFYLDRPKYLRNIWHYDIRSAYPEAMKQLPDPETATWEAVDRYEHGAHAIWEVSGKIVGKRCLYRPFMHHDAQWVAGSFARVRVTSYELDAALALGEVQITSCTGWVMRGTPGTGPLAQYVDEFYAMKRNAKTDTDKAAAKLFLNSLYGKFFQKVPLGNVTGYDIDSGEMVITDPTQDFDYEAGGLYHPPIASLITGYVRAKIHQLEHQFKSVMTSTDGFFAYEPPVKAMLGDDLGMLSAEIGNLRIWRERLYIFKPHDSDKQTYALHGFRGSVAQLERMPLTRGLRFHYGAQAMITLKMSTRTFECDDPSCKLRHKYDPGEFVQLPFDVMLPVANGP